MGQVSPLKNRGGRSALKNQTPAGIHGKSGSAEAHTRPYRTATTVYRRETTAKCGKGSKDAHRTVPIRSARQQKATNLAACACGQKQTHKQTRHQNRTSTAWISRNKAIVYAHICHVPQTGITSPVHPAVLLERLENSPRLLSVHLLSGDPVHVVQRLESFRSKKIMPVSPASYRGSGEWGRGGGGAGVRSVTENPPG